jgi:hypothetical protein
MHIYSFIVVILFLSINTVFSAEIIRTPYGLVEGEPKVGMMAARKVINSCKKSEFVWAVGTIAGMRPGRIIKSRIKLMFKDCFELHVYQGCRGRIDQANFEENAKDVLLNVMKQKYKTGYVDRTMKLLKGSFKIMKLKRCDENMTEGIDASDMDHYFLDTKY